MIHKGISFTEKPWKRDYFELNTKLHAKATHEFEKDFFKLMNKSVFRKTVKKIRNRVDVRLVNNQKKASKLAVKANFKHCTMFDKNLFPIHKKRTKLVFDKPVYCGMSNLDVKKTFMNDLNCNYIKEKYRDCVKLLFRL